MKAIILAAGEGSRLRPYTEDRPKCMVEYKGKPLIDYTIENIISCGIKTIDIVLGYKSDVLKSYLKDKYGSVKIHFFINNDYSSTNMVYTLFKTGIEFKEEVIVTYSDIVYSVDVLKGLVGSSKDIAVVVDKDWKKLWDIRMEDPLKDAETLKLNEKGEIIELGKKPKSYLEIEGQYIGLMKFKQDAIKNILDIYNGLPQDIIYDGKDFKNMYMTSFIQIIIDKGIVVSPEFINGGWIEIDTVEDLRNLEEADMV